MNSNIAILALVVAITVALISGFRAKGIAGVFAFLFVGVGILVLFSFLFRRYAVMPKIFGYSPIPGIVYDTAASVIPLPIPTLILGLICLVIGFVLAGRRHY